MQDGGLEAKCFPHTAIYQVLSIVLEQGRGRMHLCCRGFINIGCGPCLPLTACLIAWLHANRGECWLSGSFAPSYVIPDLIHCSEARVGIPSCTWKQAVGRNEKQGEWEEGREGEHHAAQREKWVVINNKNRDRKSGGLMLTERHSDCK